MSYAIVCRSSDCVRELTKDQSYFASTSVIQGKQLSPLLVCTPGQKVLRKYRELKNRRADDDSDEQENGGTKTYQSLDSMYFDDSNEQVRKARADMYERNYSQCVVLPTRFDLPLSNVRRLDGNFALSQH